LEEAILLAELFPSQYSIVNSGLRNERHETDSGFMIHFMEYIPFHVHFMEGLRIHELFMKTGVSFKKKILTKKGLETPTKVTCLI
jgi:hypothetical protein